MGRVTPRQCSTVRAAAVRAIEHALGAPIVLVAGEGGAMDRELRDRKSPAVVG